MTRSTRAAALGYAASAPPAYLTRLIETSGRRCGPGRDGSEPGRSVERSRLAWLLIRLPPCWVWLSNDVPAGRGLAVAWLKRGECQQGPGIRRARHGPCPP